MTQFDDRLEGEMKTHEKEMLRKAIIKKHGSQNLFERIQYIMSIYHHDRWTAAEMFAKLTELGLEGSNSQDDVKKEFNNPGNTFSSNVER